MKILHILVQFVLDISTVKFSLNLVILNSSCCLNNICHICAIEYKCPKCHFC